ncbi:MAG TPA: ATP-dependent helicase [Terrimesophilobacter sp.]|nr:ATP-dependent helicase [Terrimesophilobacter sp.]
MSATPASPSNPAALSDPLEGLDAEQRLAAETLLGPVVLLAGAGTGKTRAITHRIAHGVRSGVYSPSRVMVLSFTNRAAGEVRSRLKSLGAAGVASRTFHSAALSQLGHFWPEVAGGSLPSILNLKARLIGDAARVLKLKLDTATLRDVASEIEWRKVSGLTIEQYADAARTLPPSVSLDEVVGLHRAYERLKDERRQLDFEDVLLACAGMLESEPRVADQVRAQYRFFVVDEYQDVSPAQQRLLDLWLGERNDVCVVGDASQTIYSFAGARPEFLLGFAKRFPEAVVIRLESNYRSTPSIVETANRLMRGRGGALELRSAAPEQGAAAPGSKPTFESFATDAAEARAVAARVADQLKAGTSASEIAVLYRMNVQAAPLEAALADLGVSTVQRGGGRFFDQPEVKRALLMLRGATIVESDEPLFKTVSDVLRTLGWTQDPPPTGGAVRERWESLNAIMSMAEAQPPGTGIVAFVAELTDAASTHDEPTLDAVTLATLHAAKGLEWHTVHLVGVNEGLVPISYATAQEAIDEERRLLYVGITRARQRLHVSWSLSSQRGARAPSRFLSELGVS